MGSNGGPVVGDEPDHGPDVLLTHHASRCERALARTRLQGCPSAPCERRRAGGTARRRAPRRQTLRGTGAANSDIASRWSTWPGTAYLWSVEPSTGRELLRGGWSGPEARIRGVLKRRRRCGRRGWRGAGWFGACCCAVRGGGARGWTGVRPSLERGRAARSGRVPGAYLRHAGGSGDMKPSGHGQSSSST